MKDERHVYECTDCNEMFYADEPCEDRDICDNVSNLMENQIDEGKSYSIT